MTAENQDTLVAQQAQQISDVQKTGGSMSSDGTGLWRDLADRNDLTKQAQAWAALIHAQFDERPETGAVAVFAFRYDVPSRQLTPIGGSPRNRVGSALAIDAAQSAVDNARPVARGEMPSHEGQSPTQPMAAAAPIIVNGEPCGVVVVEMQPTTQPDMRWAIACTR